MSAENVALLEDIYKRWAQGDFRTPVSEGFTVELAPEFPDAGKHVGVEGVAAYMRGFLEPWERITITAEEMIEENDQVLVRVFQQGTGDLSGIEVEVRYFMLWSFEGATPIRVQSIMEESDAMARVGGG